MNEMSTRTEHLRSAAFKATREYIDSLVKDFLDYAEEFRKSLNDILKNGKTDDGWLCLSGKEAEQDPAQVFFDEDTVKCALETLCTLNTDNRIDVINNIYYMDSSFLLFYSFSRMKKLEYRISQCTSARELL